MEARGLAATTIDRRLSSLRLHRFAHIDGRIAFNHAQYVRRPKVDPNDAAVNGLRISEACSADIENLGSERGHRILRIVGKGKQAGRHPVGAEGWPAPLT